MNGCIIDRGGCVFIIIALLSRSSFFSFFFFFFFLKKKWQDILLRNCKKTEGVVKGRKKSLQDSKFATMNPSRDGKMTVNVFKSQYYPLHAISRHDFEIYTL